MVGDPQPGRCIHGPGVHGQSIYIDPKAEMVIVRYASHPIAGNAANDGVTLPAFEAMARQLTATLDLERYSGSF